MLKQFIKKILISLHIDLTKNIHYDRLTLKIFDKVLQPDSNCIDIGCHKGEILEEILKRSPDGHHYAFEPIPQFYNTLKSTFASKNVTFSNIALSDKKGNATFNYVVDAPAYSGLRKRDYKLKEPKIEELNVRLDKLDNVLPDDFKVDFIKLDVEGAEFDVLKGAKEVLLNQAPTIIFEFGLGASDHYNVMPDEFYSFLKSNHYEIYLLQDFLGKQVPLTEHNFVDIYDKNNEYYFIAAPEKNTN